MNNYYRFDISPDYLMTQLHESQIDPIVIKNVNLFKQRIVSLYEKKQIGRKGISSLGNEIKYDKIICDIFENRVSNLIKSTRNKSEILQLFLKSIVEVQDDTIYFLILNKDFLKISKIFDGTSINLHHWEYWLSFFSKHMSLKSKKKNIIVIEICGIEGYNFYSFSKKYSRIEKIN